MPCRLILIVGYFIAAVSWADVRLTYAQPATIELSDLPEPPPDIASLLNRGHVRFSYGAAAQPSPLAMPQGRQLSALTIYKLNYDFRHLSVLRPANNSYQWVSSIRLGRQGIDFQHTVWFRERPDFENFWTNRLLLHELDHVRISSDPMIEKSFKELLRDNPLVSPGTLGKAFAEHAELEKHVQAIHQQITSLIDIRYQELDRQTEHGQQALPENSTLESILRPVK